MLADDCQISTMLLLGNTGLSVEIIPLSALNNRVSTEFARGVDWTQRRKNPGFSLAV
jgi:hypothetical protein